MANTQEGKIVQDEKLNDEINIHLVKDDKGKEKEKVKENKEEKENEPKEGSPRWKEIYWKTKEQERQLEEIKNQLKAKDEDIEILKTTSKELLDLTKKVQEDSAEVTLAELKEKRKVARESGEWDKVDILDEQIDKIKESKNKVVQIPVQKKPDIPKEMADEAQNFINNTKWYNNLSSEYNEDMSAFAIGLETKLLPKHKGSFKELYKTIREKTEKQFGYKKTPERQNVNPVEGVSGESSLDDDDKESSTKLDAKTLRFCELTGIKPDDFIKKQKTLMSKKGDK